MISPARIVVLFAIALSCAHGEEGRFVSGAVQHPKRTTGVSFEQHGNVCCGRSASIERASAGECSLVSRTDGCEHRHLGRAPTPVVRGVTTRPVVAVTNGFVVSITCSCPTAVNLWLSVRSCVVCCVVRLKSEHVFCIVLGTFHKR